LGFFDTILNAINDLTWGWALIPFLVILGCFFTISSGFVQFRFFKRMFRVLGRSPDSDPNQISARAALLVSVGGRVGGGNIAGCGRSR
jgi:alanine or glycine:cation symporter, AGCS family